jgi:hypothetical protein
MKKLITLVICGPIFLSCNQISKSIKETFNPNDTVVNKQTQNKTPESSAHPSALLQSETHTTTSTTTEIHTTTHTERHLAGKNINFLTNKSELIRAETAMKKLPQYAGKEIFLYSTIHFYNDGSIHAMLQHPQHPEYVDNYEYKDGVWSAPKPEQLSVRDNIQRRLIPLNKFSFANVASVTQTYNEKASSIEGAKPTTGTYILIRNNEIRWYPISIEGSRERYSIEFNADGTLKNFKQE